MSPRLQRLRAEIASDLEAFRARVNELSALPPLASAGRPQLAEAAVALHHAYGAVEAALTRIARAVAALELDGARLEELRRQAAELEPFISADLGRFDGFLAEASGA